MVMGYGASVGIMKIFWSQTVVILHTIVNIPNVTSSERWGPVSERVGAQMPKGMVE